jgi:hypothetical protein
MRKPCAKSSQLADQMDKAILGRATVPWFSNPKPSGLPCQSVVCQRVPGTHLVLAAGKWSGLCSVASKLNGAVGRLPAETQGKEGVLLRVALFDQSQQLVELARAVAIYVPFTVNAAQ